MDALCYYFPLVDDEDNMVIPWEIDYKSFTQIEWVDKSFSRDFQILLKIQE